VELLKVKALSSNPSTAKKKKKKNCQKDLIVMVNFVYHIEWTLAAQIFG
jgi:hypothetical protein